MIHVFRITPQYQPSFLLLIEDDIGATISNRAHSGDWQVSPGTRFRGKPSEWLYSPGSTQISCYTNVKTSIADGVYLYGVSCYPIPKGVTGDATVIGTGLANINAVRWEVIYSQAGHYGRGSSCLLRM